MSAYEIPMAEFKIRHLLAETYALTTRCRELIEDPFGASWNGPPWDETPDLDGYKYDEIEDETA